MALSDRLPRFLCLSWPQLWVMVGATTTSHAGIHIGCLFKKSKITYPLTSLRPISQSIAPKLAVLLEPSKDRRSSIGALRAGRWIFACACTPQPNLHEDDVFVFGWVIRYQKGTLLGLTRVVQKSFRNITPMKPINIHDPSFWRYDISDHQLLISGLIPFPNLSNVSGSDENDGCWSQSSMTLVLQKVGATKSGSCGCVWTWGIHPILTIQWENDESPLTVV